MRKRLVFVGVVAVFLIIAGIFIITKKQKDDFRNCGSGPKFSVSLPSKNAEGFWSYTTVNTPGLLSNKVRTLQMRNIGIYFGYRDDLPATLSFFDGTSIETCQSDSVTVSGLVNAICINDWTTAPDNDLWVLTDGNGVFHFTDAKKQWEHLPNDVDPRGYACTLDSLGQFYGTTWNGVIKYNTDTKALEYDNDLTDPNGPRHIDAILMWGSGLFWEGYIGGDHPGGISRVIPNRWEMITAATHPNLLKSDNLRKFMVSPDEKTVWIVADPGISTLDRVTGKETILSLPNDGGTDIQFDYKGRPIVSTHKGVFIEDGAVWKTLTKEPVLAIALGCKGCRFDEHTLFMATEEHGIWQGTLPQ